MWTLSPPMRATMARLLQLPDNSSSHTSVHTSVHTSAHTSAHTLAPALGSAPVSLVLAWSLQRSAPLSTQRGGPVCSGTMQLQLSGQTRSDLLKVRLNPKP